MKDRKTEVILIWNRLSANCDNKYFSKTTWPCRNMAFNRIVTQFEVGL